MQQNSGYIRLAADLQSDSIVDGPGLRTVIWTQGCSHNCPGCQNPQTHDFNGGGLIDIDLVKGAIDELEYQTGITFSGGDPMFQPYACNELAEYCKNKGYNIWVYTGFTYEELIKLSENKPIYREFLNNIDVLVDGKFIEEEKNLNLLFRGSNNQRLIDVPSTLEKGEVVLLNEYEYHEEKFFEKKVPMFV
jgi:anaerobic ribonucleoside-triphosphate reductase activating protein